MSVKNNMEKNPGKSTGYGGYKHKYNYSPFVVTALRPLLQGREYIKIPFTRAEARGYKGYEAEYTQIRLKVISSACTYADRMRNKFL
jgi:hypothetical protein